MQNLRSKEFLGSNADLPLKISPIYRGKGSLNVNYSEF